MLDRAVWTELLLTLTITFHSLDQDSVKLIPFRSSCSWVVVWGLQKRQTSVQMHSQTFRRDWKTPLGKESTLVAP